MRTPPARRCRHSGLRVACVPVAGGTPIAPPRGRGDGYAPTPRAHGSRFACVRDLAQHADTPSAGAGAEASHMWHASEARPVRSRCLRLSIAASARGRYWRARLSLAALCYQLPPPMCAARASNPRRAGKSTHPASAWHLSESTAPVLFLSSCVLSSGDRAASARPAVPRVPFWEPMLTLNLASYKRCNLNLQV